MGNVESSLFGEGKSGQVYAYLLETMTSQNKIMEHFRFEPYQIVAHLLCYNNTVGAKYLFQYIRIRRKV